MLRLIYLISLCILLASCTHLQKKSGSLDVTQSASKNWSLNGKFALSNGKKNGSGKISYSVNNKTIHAKFKAPLGQGSWEVKQQNNKAELISSKHHPMYGNSAQKLISQELGWNFPWDSLIYWLQGFKSNEKITTHLSNNLKEIQDNGWTITYAKWIQTANGFLPKKIKASKPPYTVKLIIYNWNFD